MDEQPELSSTSTAKRPDIFILLLLAISLGLNVYLGVQVKRLAGNQTPAPPVVLPEGTEMEAITVSDLNNKNEVLTFKDSKLPTLLYIFSPSCVWCDRNLNNIKTLAESRGTEYRFIGISLSEIKLKEYLDTHHFSMPVYKNLLSQTRSKLGLGGTPQTLVISSEGKIIKNWVGAYSENLQQEIENFFGMKIPGLPNQDEARNLSQSCP
jgi:hypothetical protein